MYHEMYVAHERKLNYSKFAWHASSGFVGRGAVVHLYFSEMWVIVLLLLSRFSVSYDPTVHYILKFHIGDNDK